MPTYYNKTILILSLLLSISIATVSCYGLLIPGFYSAETSNWQVQSVGQDEINLFLIIPCLLITSILTHRTTKIVQGIWGGIILYLIYTYILYCFDIHFNKLFILYCICFGLSFYSFMYFMLCKSQRESKVTVENGKLRIVVATFLIIVSAMFYFLWLSDIVPAIIHGITPKSIVDTGLPTNGVHVLDLSILLPGIFITGVFLLKRRPLGFVLTPVILTFFVLMDITIGFLTVMMKIKGIGSDLSVTYIMVGFAAVSLILLIWYLKNIKILGGNKT